MSTHNGVKLGPNSPAVGLRTCRSEAAEEQLCDDLVARMAGPGAVVQFSQAQIAQQTRGIPDRRYRILGTTLWFEVKAEDGQLTESQWVFLQQELAHGALAACGTLEDLRRVLAAMRFGAPQAVRDECQNTITSWKAKGFRKERPSRRRRGGR